MKEQTPNYNQMAYNLLDAATNLSNILGWNPDEHGFIKINYADAAVIIATMQRNAKVVADELSWIASGDADLSEIYPQLKGGEQ